MCAAQPHVEEDPTDVALKHKLRQFSQFFDRLVELVPARYYIDSEREEPANTRFLKKSAKAEVKRVAKDAAKKRKREKLDPDSAQTTLDVQVCAGKVDARKGRAVLIILYCPLQREEARKKQKGAAAEAEDLNGSGGPGLQYAVPTGALCGFSVLCMLAMPNKAAKALEGCSRQGSIGRAAAGAAADAH